MCRGVERPQVCEPSGTMATLTADEKRAFQGLWEDSDGAFVIIDGSTMRGGDGTLLELTFRSADTCCFRTGNEVFEGALTSDDRILWCDGAQWVRKQRLGAGFDCMQDEASVASATIDSFKAGTPGDSTQDARGQQMSAEELEAELEAAGIPIRRLRSLNAAKALFLKVDRLRGLRLAHLRDEHRRLGFSPIPGATKEELVEILTTRAMWAELTVPELLNECRACRVSDFLRSDIEAGQAEELCERLFRVTCMRRWEDQGIHAKRIGSPQAAEALVEQWERLDDMSLEELQLDYSKRGFSAEVRIGREDLVHQLRALLLWDALPIAELLEECNKQGVPEVPCFPDPEGRRICPDDGLAYTFAELVEAYSHEWSEVELQGYWRDDCVPVVIESVDLPDQVRRRALVERLLPRHRVQFYQSRGVPAERFGSFEPAAALASLFSSFGTMSDADLRKELAKLGFAVAPASREARLERLRKVHLWRELPLAELQLEWKGCAPRLEEKGLPTKGPGQHGSEAEQRYHLQEFLHLSLRVDEWLPLHAGLPAQQLESIQAVVRLAERWRHLGIMSFADLKKESMDWGIAQDNLDRKDLVHRLQTVATWSELAFAELQKECRALGLNSIARPDQRHELMESLLVALKWKFSDRQASGRQGADAMPSRQVSPVVIDYFRILQLPPTANFEAVKRSFRLLALKYHPDKNLGASQAQAAKSFKELLAAYEGLSTFFGVTGK